MKLFVNDWTYCFVNIYGNKSDVKNIYGDIFIVLDYNVLFFVPERIFWKISNTVSTKLFIIFIHVCIQNSGMCVFVNFFS